MRFLCLSDIHGDAYALDRVLTEAEAWGYDQLVVCGDLCFPGPKPLEVWKILLERRALCTQGIADRALAEIDPRRLVASTQHEQERVAQLATVRESLGEIILARLARLPTIARLHLESGHEMLVVHGSPVDPTVPITHDLSDEEVAALIGDASANLVVCGGDHVPFQRQLDDLRVVGVGSVGDRPNPEMAHAAIVTSTPAGTHVTQYEVKVPHRQDSS